LTMLNETPPVQLLNKIAQTIYDKKGFNIVAIDVQGISTLTDFFVIAEGSVDRHVKALGKAVVDEMEELGESPIHVEGDVRGDWVVIDYGNIVIHLFVPNLREQYGLERVWHTGSIVDLDIVTKP